MPAWPGGPACRAVSCLPRTAPSCRPGRAITVPRAGGMAQGTARRHGGLPAQGRARPMPDLYFLFLFRISKLHFLTSQLGWTDGPTDPLPLAHSMPLSLAPHCFPVSSGRVAMATMAKRAQSCCHSRRHSLFPSLLLYSKPRPAQAGRKPDVSSVVSYVKRRRQGPRVRI